MIVAFELPDELKGATYEKILSDMLGRIPARYDKTEGGFIFDMTAPPALEAEELIQFRLALALKMNFHMWAEGRWLDYHASDCGLERRPANAAYGSVKVKTAKAVTFPKGFVFSVPSVNGVAAIDFEVTDEAKINGEGVVNVKAVIAGVGGNVAADSITIMKNPLENVMNITNEEALTGGTEAESDESLRQRIDDFYAGRSSSFVGNCADYRRWALSVAGVGYCHVIPTYDGENTVKVVLADSNGTPANENICDTVEKFIFGGKHTAESSHTGLERLAPIGLVKWSVEPFKLKNIDLTITATLTDEANFVEERFRAALNEFIKTLADDELNYGVLRHVDIVATLAGVEGVKDFKPLLVNGAIQNITFAADELPAVGAINFI